jgi:hypothetical protein
MFTTDRLHQEAQSLQMLMTEYQSSIKKVLKEINIDEDKDKDGIPKWIQLADKYFFPLRPQLVFNTNSNLFTSIYGDLRFANTNCCTKGCCNQALDYEYEDYSKYCGQCILDYYNRNECRGDGNEYEDEFDEDEYDVDDEYDEDDDTGPHPYSLKLPDSLELTNHLKEIRKRFDMSDITLEEFILSMYKISINHGEISRYYFDKVCMMLNRKNKNKLLYSDTSWLFDTFQKPNGKIEFIHLIAGLSILYSGNTYENRIEKARVLLKWYKLYNHSINNSSTNKSLIVRQSDTIDKETLTNYIYGLFKIYKYFGILRWDERDSYELAPSSCDLLFRLYSPNNENAISFVDLKKFIYTSYKKLIYTSYNQLPNPLLLLFK